MLELLVTESSAISADWDLAAIDSAFGGPAI
jgi:hypothetical protein